MKANDILLFINLPAVLLILNFVKRKKLMRPFNVINYLTMAIIIIIGFLTINIRKDVKSDVLLYNYDMKTIADEFGLMYYHYNDIREAIASRNSKKKLTPEILEDIRRYFNNVLVGKEANRLKGVAKGKNIIFVQGEALQNFVIGLQVNGKEITPNLNKLTKDGLYFSSVYAQTGGGNTSDAEFMANNSLYPEKTGAVYFSKPNNQYNALPKLLKERGYFTAAMHGHTNTFWNRETVYNTFGFDTFYYNTSYSTDKIVGWGINDRDFFIESIDILKNVPKPFYSMMVTVTSHHPFGYYKHENRVETGEFEDTQTNDYLEDIAFLDESIGALIEKLKVEGLYDDTVLVIYGDHRGLRDDKNEELSRFLGKENTPVTVIGDYTKIPLIISIPGRKYSEQIKTPGGHIDIMPTLLNLLDIENKYMMGKDLLNTEDDMAVLRNGSFITSQYIYDSDSDKAYDLSNKEEIDSNLIEPTIEKASSSLRTSDLILKYDALLKLD
ncbi:LTA synthase family protein [Clostridium polynesiense]|uniref:LTA synthase family protein n=1 Tax=Clostridium polynesiense TaxID=1325933 RepID=UPI00058DD8A6|nr:LTA synthase family protein [Clostridium polynesiense]